MPSVLFINRVYPPEPGATGHLLSELAPALAGAGFDVTILTTTARLNGSTDQPFNDSHPLRKVRVERVRALPFPGRAILWRALAYVALYPVLLWRALRLPRHDVVVTMTDPPLLLLLGPIIAFFKGCRLIHWTQDIYPELAEELGVLRPGGLLPNLCRALSTAALRKQSAVIAIGRCMKERLRSRGLPESSIHVIPNWAPASITSSDADAVARFRSPHALQDKFVVMYSGNFGRAHSFGEILEAAQALQPKRSDIVFLMVGEGPRLARLKAISAQIALSNIRFLPSQPLDTLPTLLKAADIHLVTMLPETCGLVVPSKLYGILAAGRPCLFVGPRRSEAARLINEYECGNVLSTGAELASSILDWSSDRPRLHAAGLRANAAATNFTAQIAAREFANLLGHCLQPLPLIPSLQPSPAKAA